MKKIYKSPIAKSVNLSSEASVMITASQYGDKDITPGTGFDTSTSGNGDGGDYTRQQSFWDYWSE